MRMVVAGGDCAPSIMVGEEEAVRYLCSQQLQQASRARREEKCGMIRLV